MILTFQNDDARFHAWRDGHPEGYVLNVPVLRSISVPAKALTLHRAGCNRLRPSASRRVHPYVCAPARPELESWHAENRPRAQLSVCQYCARRAA